MKSSTHTIKSYVQIGDDEHDCEVKFTAYPGDPGRTYGPPEFCYPPEPAEVEILSVMVGLDDRINDLTYEATQELESRILEDLFDQAHERAMKDYG